ncbi:MAG TPA: preprotein translocase subunit SecG [Candidatus Binataceae bacterium]|jgi:preprotein translocase subunit SecG|nr:preprotein translocase subunit SecG [Candidatus Binataceae bacterium]
MYSIVLAIHVTICLVLTIVVLLQQGKGADIGAVFGGSSQTVFGSGGAGNFLTKLTGGLAAAFFVTSIYLAYNSNRRLTSSIFTGSSAPVTAPAKVPLPAVPANKPTGSQK